MAGFELVGVRNFLDPLTIITLVFDAAIRGKTDRFVPRSGSRLSERPK